jgi:acyl-coenzyme A synthetase/AMP-(fatty) acid ligase
MHTPFGARLGRYALALRAPAAIATPRRDIGYAELAGRVGRCAAWLVRAGCRPEEVVGITVADEVAHFVAGLALLTLGVPQVCLATSAPAAMRRQLADRLGVRAVVVADPADAPPDCVALALPPDLFTGANGDDLPALAADPDAPAIYFTSSGTTGAPKIFAMSQRAMVWRATHILASEDAGPGYRAYAPTSIEQAPANSKRYNCACLGHTSVFDDADAAEPRTLPALCARMGVTSVELSGLQAAGLLHGAAAGPFASGTQVHVSGMRTPGPLRHEFRERFGVPLSIHYGAREFGRFTSTYPDPADDVHDSVGTPVPWIDLELVDDDGRPVAPGAIGQVRARAECMTHAYFRDPEATARR